MYIYQEEENTQHYVLGRTQSIFHFFLLSQLEIHPVPEEVRGRKTHPLSEEWLYAITFNCMPKFNVSLEMGHKDCPTITKIKTLKIF